MIQDANTPKGTKTINSTTPLTVKGDKYVKTTVNNDGLNLGLDENQLNNTITNITNNTVAGKGLHFGANSGSDVLNKLDSKVTIQGEGAKADSEYSGKNVKTKISQGADGNTIIELLLAKDASFNSVTTGNTIINNTGLSVGGKTYVTSSGLNANDQKITNVADGVADTDAVNVRQLKKITVNGATAKSGKNITVDNDHKVNLNDNITLGDDNDSSKQVNIDGNAATITAGSGDNAVKIDGSNGTVKSGKVIINGQTGTVNGLTNLTWDPNNITSGQAATEDQLKAVSGEIVKQSQKYSSVKEGKNIKVTTGTNDKGGIEYTVATLDDLNLTSVTTGNTKMNTDGITIKNSSADSSKTVSLTSKGLDNGGNKITNVAPGEISKTSTDAINGSQLYQTNSVVNSLSNVVNDMDDRVNRVGAGAAALAALHPLDFDPDDKWDFAAGYGNYKNASAVAVGAYYRPNEDTMFSVGGSFGGGNNMVNAGVTLKLGRGNHVSTSRVAMAKELKDLRAELEHMKNAMVKVSEGKKLDNLDLAQMQLFPDIPENHWAYDYVATLAGNGVIVGYPDGQFKGDRMMTRYEMAALIYRAMQNGAVADDRMARALKEFEPELERIRVDTITKHSDGTPDIQRVRVIKGRG